MRKRKQAAGIVLAATLTAMLFAGCQKSPETEIVHNKDFDNMIEQAENTEASTTEVQEVAADYDKYETDFEDTSMHVKVHVDAQVDIPQTEKLSIFRVKQKKIDLSIEACMRSGISAASMAYLSTTMAVRKSSMNTKAIRM